MDTGYTEVPPMSRVSTGRLISVQSLLPPASGNRLERRRPPTFLFKPDISGGGEGGARPSAAASEEEKRCRHGGEGERGLARISQAMPSLPLSLSLTVTCFEDGGGGQTERKREEEVIGSQGREGEREGERGEDGPLVERARSAQPPLLAF